MHARLRRALQVARDPLDGAGPDAGPPAVGSVRQDLLLFCHGFCAALTGHHRGCGRDVVPRGPPRPPGATPERLQSHLDGLAAITGSHFAFEERRLLPVLDDLPTPHAAPAVLFGPLA